MPRPENQKGMRYRKAALAIGVRAIFCTSSVQELYCLGVVLPGQARGIAEVAGSNVKKPRKRR